MQKIAWLHEHFSHHELNLILSLLDKWQVLARVTGPWQQALHYIARLKPKFTATNDIFQSPHQLKQDVNKSNFLAEVSLHKNSESRAALKLLESVSILNPLWKTPQALGNEPDFYYFRLEADAIWENDTLKPSFSMLGQTWPKFAIFLPKLSVMVRMRHKMIFLSEGLPTYGYMIEDNGTPNLVNSSCRNPITTSVVGFLHLNISGQLGKAVYNNQIIWTIKWISKVNMQTWLWVVSFWPWVELYWWCFCCQSTSFAWLYQTFDVSIHATPVYITFH